MEEVYDDAFAISYILIQLNMNDKSNRKDKLSVFADMQGVWQQVYCL